MSSTERTYTMGESTLFNFSLSSKDTLHISVIVETWLEGYIGCEYSCKNNLQEFFEKKMNMTDIKTLYYNLFVTELKKQTKMDKIEMIEEQLGGLLQVFLDEEDIKVCIVNESYYDAGDSDELYDDNNDY